MKTLVLGLMLLAAGQTWANDMLLHCRFVPRGQFTSFNVQPLMSPNSCRGQIFKAPASNVPTRYKISICGGKQVQGVIEVLTHNGDWAEVKHFSNQECYFAQEFKPIGTNYPCHPSQIGHNGQCQ